MTNGEIYKRTFIFSWMRLAINVFCVVALIALMVAGAAITGDPLGLFVGLVIGVFMFFIVLHFFGYLFEAGQIAMMSQAVTTDTLPDDVLGAGKAAVKRRFGTVAAFYAATSLIKGVFNQISAGVNALSSSTGDNVLGAIGSVVDIVMSVAVSYLCDCCLGWVFIKGKQGSFKSTCQGAVIYFKNWKVLLKNMGRIFAFGIVSLLIIGGAFTALGYLISSSIPAIANLNFNMVLETSEGSTPLDPATARLVLSGIFGVILWAILHSVFIRPFVLVGVLRNYLTIGLTNEPDEASYAKLDEISPKFREAHEKASANE